MKDRNILYYVLFILGLITIIFLKFIITNMFGWIEIILLTVSIISMIFSSIKLYQISKFKRNIKLLLEIVSIIIIFWFALLSIDYKRHKNLYDPLFCIGYNVKQDYDIDIQTGQLYKVKSTFYIFGIKINEINVIRN